MATIAELLLRLKGLSIIYSPRLVHLFHCISMETKWSKKFIEVLLDSSAHRYDRLEHRIRCLLVLKLVSYPKMHLLDGVASVF